MTETPPGEPPLQRVSGRNGERVELRPQLTARRETPPEIGRARLSRSPSALPGAAARRFSGREGAPAVRAWPGPDADKRKVTVITRKILTPHGGRRVLMKNLAYIRRGAAETGAPNGVFFSQTENQTDPRKFVERCQNDRSHYRLIVNPEDGAELGDLKAYARRLMEGVAEDLGSDLDWIAGAHFDTGRPHLHMMLRARRSNGRSLKLSASYLTSGLRDRARDVTTQILGPVPVHVKSSIIQADRMTPLDHVILEASRDSRIEAARIAQAYRPSALRRLLHLESKGWATQVSPGVWRLPPDFRHTLIRAGIGRDRENAAARILAHSAKSDQRSRMEAVSPQPGERLAGAYVGVTRASGFADGPRAVVLDLADGRLAHVLVRDARSVMCLDRLREGAAIEVTGFARGDRPGDLVIAEVAAGRGGVWSAADHAEARPGDWPRFIAAHEKRAQAMSMAGACTALEEGRFAIPADYLSLARQADVAQWGDADLRLRVLDDRLLEEQVSAPGLTWLDRLMTQDQRPAFSGPFGEAVNGALAEREKRLRIIGLGSGEPLVLNEADIRRLTTLDIRSVFETLGRDGKAVFLVKSGQGAAGVYTGRKQIAGVPYAVLEDPSALNLVPWSPGMEACRGRTLTAVVQDGATTFRSVRDIGRDLGRG